MTNYESYFGDPGRMAAFIVGNCCYDCHVCPFSGLIPCDRAFGLTDKDMPEMIRWLQSETMQEGYHD